MKLAAIVVLALVGIGISKAVTPASRAAAIHPSLQAVGGAQPIAASGAPCFSTRGRDYVSSGSFIVPTGKTFVLTGLASGAAPQFLPIVLLINGIQKMSVRLYDADLHVVEAPDGILAASGDQVVCEGAYALGYLVDNALIAAAHSYMRCTPSPLSAIRVQNSYTVPSGKALLLVAFGCTNATPTTSSSIEYLDINGNHWLWHSVAASHNQWTSVESIPEGLVAKQGDTVSFTVVPVSGNSLTPVAWGYLIDY